MRCPPAKRGGPGFLLLWATLSLSAREARGVPQDAGAVGEAAAQASPTEAPDCAGAQAQTMRSPKSAEAWQALGDCQARQRRTRESIDAYARALDALAHRPDPANRLELYARLSRAGAVLEVPESRKRLRWATRAAGCPVLHVGRFRADTGGAGVRAARSGLRVCTQARFLKRQALAEAQLDCLDVVLAESEESNCRPADVGGEGGSSSVCAQGRAGRACREAVARCEASGDLHRERKRTCRFVFADGCRRRIGAVCDGEPMEFDREHLPEWPAE